MNESLDVTPAETGSQVNLETNPAPIPTDSANTPPTQENIAEEKKEEATTKPTEVESKEIRFQRCQRNLQLLLDLPANRGKVTTDIPTLNGGSQELQNYEVVTSDDQGNLTLRSEQGEEFTFSKKDLLADARTSTAELINSEFASLDDQEQAKITNQAHEAGFIMASDLQALGTKPPDAPPNPDTNSQEYKDWQAAKTNWANLENILNTPIVDAQTLGNALDLLGIPHSALSFKNSLVNINQDINQLNLKLKERSASPDQIPIIKARIQKMENRAKALDRVGKELIKKFEDQNWSTETAYQKIVQGEMSGEEFYNQYFASLFKDNEVQQMIDQAEISEEQKVQFKEKIAKGLKIGGGIIGILMILMLMQGMGGGGGQAG